MGVIQSYVFKVGVGLPFCLHLGDNIGRLCYFHPDCVNSPFWGNLSVRFHLICWTTFLFQRKPQTGLARSMLVFSNLTLLLSHGLNACPSLIHRHLIISVSFSWFSSNWFVTFWICLVFQHSLTSLAGWLHLQPGEERGRCLLHLLPSMLSWDFMTNGWR